MYLVLLYSGSTLTCAGVFTSLATAQTFIGTSSAGTSSGGTFYIVQAQSLQGMPPGSLVTPITSTASYYTVVLGVQDALGNTQFFAYGNFPTLIAAQQYIASRAFPGGCTPVQIGTQGS